MLLPLRCYAELMSRHALATAFSLSSRFSPLDAAMRAFTILPDRSAIYAGIYVSHALICYGVKAIPEDHEWDGYAAVDGADVFAAPMPPALHADVPRLIRQR